MLAKRRKRKLFLIILVLCIASGFILYFLVNLSSFFDVSHYRTVNDFTIDYSQEYGGTNVDFQMSYSNYAIFDSILIFQTISSEDIEEIGITEVSYEIYRDEELIWYNDLNFPEPFIYRIDSFIIDNIRIHNNISCIGTINAQFNVGGIVQNETINFILSIIMPVNPYEIRYSHLQNSLWAGFGLGILQLVLIGLIFRTILTWKREATYSEEAKEKDQEYFNYIGNKVKELRKEAS